MSDEKQLLDLPFAIIMQILEYYEMNMGRWQNIHHPYQATEEEDEQIQEEETTPSPTLLAFDPSPTLPATTSTDLSTPLPSPSSLQHLLKMMFGYFRSDPYRQIRLLFPYIKVGLTPDVKFLEKLRFRNLKGINLTTFLLSRKHAKQLISSNPSLVKINSIAYDPKLGQLSHFNEVFPPNRHWESITIECDHLEVGQEAMESIGRMRELKDLNLIFTKINDESAKQIAKIPALKYLKVEKCHVMDGGAAYLFTHSNLKHLYIGENNKITLASYQALVGNTTLTKLSLNYNKKFGDEGIKLLLKNTKLKYLELVCCGITDIGLELLSHHPSIEHLSIVDNTGITDRGIQLLSKNRLLKSLNVSYNEITDDSIKALQNCTLLKELDISNTLITNEGLKYLPPAIEVLHLRFTEIDDEALSILSTNKSLKTLNLFCTKVTDDGILLLAQQHTPIVDLNLQGTGVTDKAVQALLEMTQIKCLNAENTGITDFALSNIALSKSLSSLMVGGNEGITDKVLEYLVQSNHSLNELTLHQCPNISPDCKRHILLQCPWITELRLE